MNRLPLALKFGRIVFPAFWRPNKKAVLPGCALKKDLHMTNDIVITVMLPIAWLVA
jgi:hypothetical protein